MRAMREKFKFMVSFIVRLKIGVSGVELIVQNLKVWRSEDFRRSR